MGEENVKVAITGGRPSGMLLYANGQPIGPIEDIQTTTLEPESGDEQRFLGIDLAQGNDFTATISFTPRFPHVSRKRFVRNLKRAGCSKKQAKRIAWRVQKGGRKSYDYANFLARIAGWWNVW